MKKESDIYTLFQLNTQNHTVSSVLLKQRFEIGILVDSVVYAEEFLFVVGVGRVSVTVVVHEVDEHILFGLTIHEIGVDEE